MISELLWLCGFILLIYVVVPNLITRVFRRNCLWRGWRTPAVALTFDDGPDARYTPRLLEQLKQCRVRATFFVIARKAEAHPELIEAMVRDGHDVQVHGLTHALVPALLPGTAIRQMTESARVLQTITSVRPHLYRPTWGLFNLASLLAAHYYGFQIVTWSVMIGDWRKVPATELVHRIQARIHPGAIIVLHDSDETWGSEPGAPDSVIASIQPLVETLHDMGYRVGSMEDLNVC